MKLVPVFHMDFMRGGLHTDVRAVEEAKTVTDVSIFLSYCWACKRCVLTGKSTT